MIALLPLLGLGLAINVLFNSGVHEVGKVPAVLGFSNFDGAIAQPFLEYEREVGASLGGFLLCHGANIHRYACVRLTFCHTNVGVRTNTCYI